MTMLTERERRGYCIVSNFIDSVQKALCLGGTMKQSVSDPNLLKTTTKTHMISPSRSSKLIVRIRKKSSARSFNNNIQEQEQEVTDHDMFSPNSNSPYYKGLTDQSLAILDDAASSSPSPPPYSPFYSPYYKGLTDYTLAIPSPNSPTHHNNIINPLPNSNTHESSPYYRGLIDYSLALHGSSSTHSSPPNMFHAHAHADISFIIEHDPLMEKVESAAAIQVDDKTVLELVPEEDASLEIEQEKPLRESSGSDQESKIEEAISEEIIMMDLITDDDVIQEEKPLRERVSEAADDEVEKIVSDNENNNAEKIILEDDGLVIEKKKPLRLRERVSEASNAYEEGNEYQYTWATKHQPVTLEDFICNRDTALNLKALIKGGCGCNHFIFEGPSNAGKRSMIRAMLREVFGADRVQVTEEVKEFNIKGEMVDNLKVRIKKSLSHIELNLSETKGYEKHVVDDLFKETYGSKTINNSLPCRPENCQAIILYEAEKLSIETLLYIKWLLEKYKGCSKVFFCCSDQSKLQHVKSLCTTVRLSSPTSEEIVKILEHIGEEEGIKLSREFVKRLILRSKNNLRQSIRALEATCRNKDILKDDDLILTGWEDDILNIAKNIIEEQSPRQLYVIRRKLQSLMIHDVPPDFIYKSLVAELTNLVDDSLRPGVAKLDKEYSKGCEIMFESVKQLGDGENKYQVTKKNAINYLKVEEFIAKFMSCYMNCVKKLSMA
ncbi:uncharacterized protein LOC130732410 [Lotus japonicus]|uniref:uncharacterized protein LOC130732410 n=1 Tax=Lotus japonicus TaxID=34305 RepID=UPI00258F27FE|nr:uncharacterized protein LOC130732410 [Lotus japonicus]